MLYSKPYQLQKEKMFFNNVNAHPKSSTFAKHLTIFYVFVSPIAVLLPLNCGAVLYIWQNTCYLDFCVNDIPFDNIIQSQGMDNVRNG